MRFDTIAVHGIYNMQEAARNQGSINEPLYLSSAEHFPDSATMEAAVLGEVPTWMYTRIHNPTLHYLEHTLALLESYQTGVDAGAFVTASGMAAVHMATEPFLVRDGDKPANIVVNARCYGGSFILFQQRYGADRGVDVRWVSDVLNVDAWAAQIDANTRFVYTEMPTNPTLTSTPLQALADAAHAQGVPLIIDATLATPALMRPLAHGADIVIHSLSKSMGISGFAIGGAVIARRNLPSRVGPDEMRADFAQYTKLLPTRDYGPGLSPFNALMILNDMRTLRTRMDDLSQKAQHVAEFLEAHPKVDAVYYPGLPSNGGHHEEARAVMHLADAETADGQPVNRYGHLMGFTVKGGMTASRAAMDGLQLIWRATDLGRVKSIATIPAISTHHQQGESGRDLAGIPSGLIRLNVGAEDHRDVIADLDQALNGIE